MLMQNFKTKAELGLNGKQLAGLVATLAALERDELVHVIDKAFDATPAQAAHALRNYLTTGKANWPEAMAA